MKGEREKGERKREKEGDESSVRKEEGERWRSNGR